MSLLREIQDAAVGSAEPIANLLRRCKILAARLGSRDFDRWVERELNGYDSKEDLPPYRILSVRSLGHFAGSFGRGMKNAPIPPSCVDKKYKELIDTSYAMQPIGAYEDLLRNPKSSSFQEPWPSDLTVLVGQQIYQAMNCLSAWKEIPRGAIVGIIDSVRNKVLTFALDIEQLSPTAGDAALGEEAISEAKVNHVFHTTIYGNVGNVAAGSQAFEQSVGALVSYGDDSSFAEQLGKLGISSEEIQLLLSAIDDDDAKERKQLGPKIGEWLGRMIGKAGQGLLKIGVGTATALLPKLIEGYLGIPH